MAVVEQLLAALPAYIPLNHLPVSTQIAAVLIGLPVLAVVVNVLHQLLVPRDPSLPPLVFHYFPVIGSAVTYGMDPYAFMFNCRAKYGDVFTFVLLGRKMTVALGSKGNNLILNGKLSQVSAEEAYTHLTTPVFGKDVVYDVPNHVLMEQKKFVKFGLSTENFRAYVPMIVNEVTTYLSTDPTFSAYQSKDASAPGKVDIFKAMSELIILTASRTLQGKEVRENLDKSFADLYHDLDGGFTPINFMFPNLPLPSYRRRDRAQLAMSNFYGEIIRKRREDNEEAEHDMLSALMQQTYKDGRPLTDREVSHIMIALLMAGQHTSSATSSWCFLHLAEKPELIKALYEEQVKYFGNPDGSLQPLDYDTQRTLPLLDAVIRETLRMHPPIHSIMRKVISDIPVPPALSAPSSKAGEDKTYVIPKGHFVVACPGVSAVDPNVWKNPQEFDPYRWIDEKGQVKEDADDARSSEMQDEKVDYGWGMVSSGASSTYLPFGAGRHRCIGEQFAYVQLGTIVSTMVREIDFKLEGRFPPQDYTSMIVLPKPPSDISFVRRASSAA